MQNLHWWLADCKNNNQKSFQIWDFYDSELPCSLCISGTFPKEQCVDDSDLKKKCFGIVIQADDGDNDDDTGDEISVNFE